MAGMRAVDPRVSFAELATWPDDGRRWELYGGEPISVPAPNWRHQRVMVALVRILSDYERSAGGGVVVAPFDIVLTEYDVLQPDVVFFGAAKRARLDPLQAAYVVPDLAIEILSRSTAARDRGRKMELLSRQGLPEYWLVDPAVEELELYTQSEDGLTFVRPFLSSERVTSATLTGLSFVLDCLFTA
jgi:Uma2 family endonuclease